MDLLGWAFWLAVGTLLYAAIATVMILRGNRSIRALRDFPPLSPAEPKRVSIIVAARNEERKIRAALHSLLHLDYPDYELIVLNDRSEDRTGEILAALAAADSRLRVIHIDELPKEWLGKNHALWVGSSSATGDYLLFTDADIVMEPTVVSRAVNALERHHLDHLTATPSMQMPTPLLGIFGVAFMVIFALFTRPWKARDPRSSCHIGIGAFNLVRRDVYREVGGHEKIRLRPDDDIKLGKIIKPLGFRQEVVYAPEFLGVEWYGSTGEAIRGLEKNAFSGTDYNIPLVLCGVIAQLAINIWPFLALLVTSGVTLVLNLAVIALSLLIHLDCARFHHAKRSYALGYPLGGALFAWILIRTMVLNLLQGGISWRGTFYSLKMLKGNKV